MRSAIVAMLRPLHALAIENALGEGTPDVNCSLGWLELKQLESWPVREDTVVRVPHFTPGQRLWLRTRCTSGGAAWVLIKVELSYTLLWGAVAAECLGTTYTRGDLVAGGVGVQHWPALPPASDLMRALMRR